VTVGGSADHDENLGTPDCTHCPSIRLHRRDDGTRRSRTPGWAPLRHAHPRCQCRCDQGRAVINGASSERRIDPVCHKGRAARRRCCVGGVMALWRKGSRRPARPGGPHLTRRRQAARVADRSQCCRRTSSAMEKRRPNSEPERTKFRFLTDNGETTACKGRTAAVQRCGLLMMADKGRTPTLRPCGPTKAWSRLSPAVSGQLDSQRRPAAGSVRDEKRNTRWRFSVPASGQARSPWRALTGSRQRLPRSSDSPI